MSDAYQPQPAHKFTFGLWTISNRGRDPFGEPVRDPLPPNDAVAMLGEVGAWGVNLHDNDLVPIDATAAERDRIVREFKAAMQQHGMVVPDGHRQPVHRPDLQGRRLHGQRPAGPGLRRAEDDGRDGPRRGTRRQDLRAVGWARGHRDRRMPAPGRRREALARSGELPVRVQHRPGVPVPVRDGGQAERAARRHLHGHHGQLPRLHPHARPPGHGGREPGGRARDHGRPELHARRRARRGMPASCSTST